MADFGGFSKVVRRTKREIGKRRLLLRSELFRRAHPEIEHHVWVGGDDRIELEDDARLELGGDLTVGYFRKRKKKKRGSKKHRTIGPPAYRPAVLKIEKQATLRTKGWVAFGPGSHTVVGRGAMLVIGEACSFTGDSTVLCSDSIEIGSECAISWGVMMMDSDMHSTVVDGVPQPQTAPIRIGNHVWIGEGAHVLKGVSIGDGAIVAAGAIVTRDVAPRTLVAGVPARPIRENVDWL